MLYNMNKVDFEEVELGDSCSLGQGPLSDPYEYRNEVRVPQNAENFLTTRL
jgi:hypothetical protein